MGVENYSNVDLASRTEKHKHRFKLEATTLYNYVFECTICCLACKIDKFVFRLKARGVA